MNTGIQLFYIRLMPLSAPSSLPPLLTNSAYSATLPSYESIVSYAVCLSRPRGIVSRSPGSTLESLLGQGAVSGLSRSLARLVGVLAASSEGRTPGAAYGSACGGL